jgi:hypothetical protein
MPPGPSSRTPFDHYKATAAPAPQPNPYRFLLRRLGITEQEFDDNLTMEVNERIRQARADSALEAIFPSTSNAEPLERILTKDDCMHLFHATGVPPGGPFWGIFRWAADLGHARYNFVRELEDHELHFLDEYD